MSELNSRLTTQCDNHELNSRLTTQCDNHELNNQSTTHCDNHELNNQSTTHCDNHELDNQSTTHCDNHELNSRPTTQSDNHELDSRPTTQSDNHELDNRPTTQSDNNNEQRYVDIINIFHAYYKRINKIENNEHMFHEYDYDMPTSTNKSSEFFYDHMFIYRQGVKNNPDLVKLYDENDIDNLNYDNIYTLMIDLDIVKVSGSLFSIIHYLANMINPWYSYNWSIIDLKKSE